MSDYFSKENTGGSIASRGFAYQDQCALIMLFEVLDYEFFQALSIETLDDFTIIFHDREELYQVKKMEFDINTINKYIVKSDKGQNFIFTSKNTSKFNGLFDKMKEYKEVVKSSRTPEEKKRIKKEIEELLKSNGIEEPEKYLLSDVHIFDAEIVEKLLFGACTQWIHNNSFIISNMNGLLDKLRLTISDLRSNRGELKKEDVYKILKEYIVEDKIVKPIDSNGIKLCDSSITEELIEESMKAAGMIHIDFSNDDYQDDRKTLIISGGDDSNPIWGEYLSRYAKEVQPYIIKIRQTIKEQGLENKTGKEVNGLLFEFLDGVIICFSWRAWGDLIQAIKYKKEGYIEYYM